MFSEFHVAKVKVVSGMIDSLFMDVQVDIVVQDVLSLQEGVCLEKMEVL